MAHWFKFKGVDSRDMGVIVQEYPPDVRPEERVEAQPVPGRDGVLHLTDWEDRPVYENVKQKLRLLLAPSADLTAVRVWLTGSGDLVYGNDPGRARRARVVDAFDMQRVLRGYEYRTTDVTFDCDPYRYESEPETVTLTTAGIVTNTGNVDALPKITVYGSGTIALAVAGEAILLSGVVDSYVIDSDGKVALMGGDLATLQMTGNFPVLAPGDNSVAWTGTVDRVEIEPRRRWL